VNKNICLQNPRSASNAQTEDNQAFQKLIMSNTSLTKENAGNDQQVVNQLREDLKEASERAQKYRNETYKLKEEMK